MHAAPPFEFNVTPGRGERVALATIGGVCAAVVAAWIWSYVDAAAGPSGRGALAWIAAVAGAAAPGLWLGWRLAPRAACTLAWRQGQWTLTRHAASPGAGAVQARLDVGGWLLLCFRPADGGPATWLAVSRRAAGPAWHALRATLFAPGAPDGSTAPDQGARA